MNISTDKNSRDTPASTTYPSNTNLPLKRKIGGGKIKLYQSRCFYIMNLPNVRSISAPLMLNNMFNFST